MASRLDSSRNMSEPAAGAEAMKNGSKTKTNTLRLSFGRIFGAALIFPHPFQQNFDPAGGRHPRIGGESEFWNVAELEAGGELVAEVRAGVGQAGEGLLLLVGIAKNGYVDAGLASIGGDGNVGDGDAFDAGVAHFEVDDFGEFLADCFGNAGCTALIHFIIKVARFSEGEGVSY
jgi:hypothetical protein